MRDLHLHLDGSLDFSLIYKMSRDMGLDLGSLGDFKKLMMVGKDCRDLNDYLSKFQLPFIFLQSKAHIKALTYNLVENLYKLGLDYSEIRFAPVHFTKEGLSQEEVILAAIEGTKKAMEDFPIKIGLIICAMRGPDYQNENFLSLDLTKKYLGDVICAFDLAGAEALYPNSDYIDLFKKAQDLQVPYTIHAGEAAGPESVWQAIKLGAKRIGHGVRSIEDEKLVDYLAENKIFLEVCIKSNLDTHLVEDIKDHPAKRLFDKGVRMSLNSDNMTVSNTNILNERRLAKDYLGFTDDDLLLMDQYAKEASFLK